MCGGIGRDSGDKNEGKTGYRHSWIVVSLEDRVIRY